MYTHIRMYAYVNTEKESVKDSEAMQTEVNKGKTFKAILEQVELAVDILIRICIHMLIDVVIHTLTHILIHAYTHPYTHQCS